MNGAEMLMKTAQKAGIEVCFTNFGTTEVPLAAAFDSAPGIRPVMGLFEGVCTGAADGWGRLQGRPAMTLLHLGPGLANGISTLHDARRAHTPLVNVVGDHMSWHVSADPPLAMNIEALAGTFSGWYYTIKDPAEISRSTAEAVNAARRGQISTLIIPHDFQKAAVEDEKIDLPQTSYDTVDDQAVREAVRLLKSYRKTGLMLGGRALRRRGLQTAARIRAESGCDLLMDNLPAYIDRGSGIPEVIRIPYFPEEAFNLLSAYEAVVLAGTRLPVSFFGREGVPGKLIPEDRPVANITGGGQDPQEALEHLAEALGTPREPEAPAAAGLTSPQGPLTVEKAGRALAAVLPEDAIVVDEGLSSGAACFSATRQAAPHTWLTIAGGSLGYGLPCATGAAVACPDRPVIGFQADGSAMYTIQALWTQARENLNVTTLIISNRSYNILKIEMARAGISPAGPCAESLMALDNPQLGWTKIAGGLGVPAVSVSTCEDLMQEIRKSLSEGGPHLIEMLL